MILSFRSAKRGIGLSSLSILHHFFIAPPICSSKSFLFVSCRKVRQKDPVHMFETAASVGNGRLWLRRQRRRIFLKSENKDEVTFYLTPTQLCKVPCLVHYIKNSRTMPIFSSVILTVRHATEMYVRAVAQFVIGASISSSLFPRGELSLYNSNLDHTCTPSAKWPQIRNSQQVQTMSRPHALSLHDAGP